MELADHVKLSLCGTVLDPSMNPPPANSGTQRCFWEQGNESMVLWDVVPCLEIPQAGVQLVSFWFGEQKGPDRLTDFAGIDEHDADVQGARPEGVAAAVPNESHGDK